MTPLITVLLPAWNAEATLASAIDSILAQTRTDFELLVIDDGSTDRTATIVATYTDPRIRLLTQPHAGIVAALNLGLTHANGSYIARMDADDVALPTRLEKQAALLDQEPDLGLVSCFVTHDAPPGGETTGYALYVEWINSLITHEEIALNRFVESPLAHPSVMFRTAFIDQHGGYRDGPFPEDYELWLRWLGAGVRMAKVPEPLLVWTDLPHRLSRTHDNYAIDAFYAIKAAYLAAWLAEHNPHHPDLVIWGAGKTSRRRAAHLEAHGCRIVRYIDIDPKRRGKTVRGMPIVMPEDFSDPSFGFIVPYVGKRGARDLIRGWLAERGYKEGAHFIMGA
jgi:glycosyltransferase involved in cell wall biosynthesis